MSGDILKSSRRQVESPTNGPSLFDLYHHVAVFLKLVNQREERSCCAARQFVPVDSQLPILAAKSRLGNPGDLGCEGSGREMLRRHSTSPADHEPRRNKLRHVKAFVDIERTHPRLSSIKDRPVRRVNEEQVRRIATRGIARFGSSRLGLRADLRRDGIGFRAHT